MHYIWISFFFRNILTKHTSPIDKKNRSTTLSWYFALLVNHPEVQEKIFNELDKFINANGRLPSFSDREETPYCLSVMKECMRLKPTTPFGLPHEATSDCKL
jgi:cytochrome P450